MAPKDMKVWFGRLIFETFLVIFYIDLSMQDPVFLWLPSDKLHMVAHLQNMWLTGPVLLLLKVKLSLKFNSYKSTCSKNQLSVKYHPYMIKCSTIHLISICSYDVLPCNKFISQKRNILFLQQAGVEL